MRPSGRATRAAGEHRQVEALPRHDGEVVDGRHGHGGEVRGCLHAQHLGVAPAGTFRWATWS
jgi:hypothetical protein